MKTFTPELDSAGLTRLREYAARFAADFPRSKPARWAGVYLQGLLLDGERKSIEPFSHRVTLPPDLTSKDPGQALQQFVSQSTWDEQAVLVRYRALMTERFASPEGAVPAGRAPPGHQPRGLARARFAQRLERCHLAVVMLPESLSSLRAERGG